MSYKILIPPENTVPSPTPELQGGFKAEPRNVENAEVVYDKETGKGYVSAIPFEQRGVPEGVATLDEDGELDLLQQPSQNRFSGRAVRNPLVSGYCFDVTLNDPNTDAFLTDPLLVLSIKFENLSGGIIPKLKVNGYPTDRYADVEVAQGFPLSNIDSLPLIQITYTVTGKYLLVGDSAPFKHAATDNRYGAGNSYNYGHVALSDSTTHPLTANNGVAATPYAVKQAMDKAISAEADAKAAEFPVGGMLTILASQGMTVPEGQEFIQLQSSQQTLDISDYPDITLPPVITADSIVDRYIMEGTTTEIQFRVMLKATNGSIFALGADYYVYQKLANGTWRRLTQLGTNRRGLGVTPTKLLVHDSSRTVYGYDINTLASLSKSIAFSTNDLTNGASIIPTLGENIVAAHNGGSSRNYVHWCDTSQASWTLQTLYLDSQITDISDRVMVRAVTRDRYVLLGASRTYTGSFWVVFDFLTKTFIKKPYVGRTFTYFEPSISSLFPVVDGFVYAGNFKVADTFPDEFESTSYGFTPSNCATDGAILLCSNQTTHSLETTSYVVFLESFSASTISNLSGLEDLIPIASIDGELYMSHGRFEQKQGLIPSRPTNIDLLFDVLMRVK